MPGASTRGDLRPSAARVLAALSVLAFGALCAGLALALPQARSLPAPAPGLPVGKALPAIVLKDAAGRPFELASLEGRPAWLAFFRGAYCPSCRAQLAELARLAPQIDAHRIRLLGMSPDAPDTLARLQSELSLGFELLSDESEAAVSALCGGVAHCQLLVDAEGTVRWAAVSENWSDVPSATRILEGAAGLLGP
jgi:peroxiredoxin